ncbi:kinase-like domain-containing protein [Chiua virens]|nr:kinase-like domain-containing protein [Chiua virens]
MFDRVFSLLQSYANLAIEVIYQGISPKCAEVHLERIPGQPVIYHGGFSIVIKSHLIGWGPKPTVVVVKCPKNVYEESDIARVRNMFEKEYRTWRRLSHRNVLPLIGVTHQLDIPCFITLWMDEGPLTDFIRRNHSQHTMERKLTILHEVASGLQYLHHSGVIHGDLTGSNILVDGLGRIFISDFGLSFTFLDASESGTSRIGAYRWAANELFVLPDLENSRPIPNKSSDIYSFGCVLWQVLSGQIPFHHVSRETQVIILKYQGKNPLDERPSDLSSTHWEFLQSAWSKKSEDRPSSDQALAFVRQELEGYQAVESL